MHSETKWEPPTQPPLLHRNRNFRSASCWQHGRESSEKKWKPNAKTMVYKYLEKSKVSPDTNNFKHNILQKISFNMSIRHFNSFSSNSTLVMIVYLLLFQEAHSSSKKHVFPSPSTKGFYNPLKSNLWSFQNTEGKHYLNPIVLTFWKQTTWCL